MEIPCSDCAGYYANDAQIVKNQRRILWVLMLNFFTMLGEVFVGYSSGSMSLVAEGWHMGSHVGALSITVLAYRLARAPQLAKDLSFGPGKLVPLGGYTSALILGLVSLLVFIESVERLFEPVAIHFNEALLVAVCGLITNIFSAWMLNVDPSHGNDNREPSSQHVHDHNIRSAFLHVIADAVTSVLAIAALLLGKFMQWNFLDPVIGMIGALVIFSWAYRLCKATGLELLDGHAKMLNWKKLRELIEVDGARIVDFHLWRIAPRANACELIVHAKQLRGLEHYREILRKNFSAQHIVIEEHQI